MGRACDHDRSRRRKGPLARYAGWLAVTALAPLLLGPAGAALGVPSASTPFAVEVAASPTSGTVPLTVGFTATVTQGVPTAVDWTFGDGASWNGTGPSALDVLHRYVAVGTFVAVATVFESTGVSSAFTRVSVESGPLSATIAVTAQSGPAPLAVTFRAIVAGGTGTYTTFAWAFGDGAVGAGPVVNFTYPTRGLYTATLTVRDSANDSAMTSLAINVTAPVGSAGPLGTLSVPTTLATAGIVGAGLAWGSLYLGRRRRSSRAGADEDADGPSPIPPGALSGGSAGLLGDALAGPVVGAAAATSSMPVPPAQERPSSPAPSPAGPIARPVVTLIVPARPGTAIPPAADEPRRWSREVVAYLGSLPILGPDDIASLDWTQKGMSERLGTGQNQVSNVLRRLVAAGVVQEQLEHVQGQPRRLKVYRLTPRGEALAREVRRRRAAERGSLPPRGRS